MICVSGLTQEIKGDVYGTVHRYENARKNNYGITIDSIEVIDD